MDKIKDDDLELYLEKIKSNTSSNSRLKYYKKATSRLDQLKDEYSKLCDVLSPDDNQDSKHKKRKKTKSVVEPESIEKIMSDMEKIHNSITKTNGDMQHLIAQYLQFKNMIDVLEINTNNFKNEIQRVDSKRSKIIIEPLDIDDIL